MVNDRTDYSNSRGIISSRRDWIYGLIFVGLLAVATSALVGYEYGKSVARKEGAFWAAFRSGSKCPAFIQVDNKKLYLDGEDDVPQVWGLERGCLYGGPTEEED